MSTGEPARFPWYEVSKVQQDLLQANSATRPLRVSDDPPGYEELEP